jgi:hypothetical protein
MKAAKSGQSGHPMQPESLYGRAWRKAVMAAPTVRATALLSIRHPTQHPKTGECRRKRRRLRLHPSKPRRVQRWLRGLPGISAVPGGPAALARAQAAAYPKTDDCCEPEPDRTGRSPAFSRDLPSARGEGRICPTRSWVGNWEQSRRRDRKPHSDGVADRRRPSPCFLPRSPACTRSKARVWSGMPNLPAEPEGGCGSGYLLD